MSIEGLTAADRVIIPIGLLFPALWLLLFLSGRKYAGSFRGLDGRAYPMKELCFVGYAALLRLHPDLKGERDRKRRKVLASLR